jgi:preprotein translocase subunit SecG
MKQTLLTAIVALVFLGIVLGINYLPSYNHVFNF